MRVSQGDMSFWVHSPPGGLVCSLGNINLCCEECGCRPVGTCMQAFPYQYRVGNAPMKVYIVIVLNGAIRLMCSQGVYPTVWK